MSHWSGRWALVTGASSGIGAALAKELAAGGANLVLAARRRERLERLASEAVDRHKVRAEVIAADLARPQACDEIFAFTKGRKIAVDVLVNNAGFGAYGEFHRIGLARQLEMVQVNIAAVLQLTHLYLPGMIERRRGDILIVASTAGFQGVPYISTYAASKAFDLLFAEALAEEMRPYGVRVCALCPGSTQTEFQQVAGEPEWTQGHQESAEKVARTGLRALARGKSCAISGLGNWLGVEGQRLAPRRLVTRVAAGMFRPRDR